MLKRLIVAGAAAVTLMGVLTPGVAQAAPPIAAPAQVATLPMEVNLPSNKIYPMDTTSEANKALRTTVAKDLAKNQYPLEGGGYVNGSDVLKPDGTINDAIYSQLSKQGQGDFTKALVKQTQVYTEPSSSDYNPSLAKANGVDGKTATTWFSELRSSSGIGSAMLTEILKDNVYADLSTGSAWFKPFSGPLSSILGFFAIVVIGLMGIRSVVDLTYIAVPYFQSGVDRISGGGGGNGGGGGTGIKLVSSAAQKAVQDGESGKNAIFSYFKKAAVEYFFLAMALLFLCFNYLWEIIGGLLNLGTGFLGF